MIQKKLPILIPSKIPKNTPKMVPTKNPICGDDVLIPALAPIMTLCITLVCRTSPNFCGIYPRPPLFSTLVLIVPDRGATNPAIVLSKVVLPIPDAPTIEIISPGLTSRLILETRVSS